MTDKNSKITNIGSWLIATKWMPPRHHISTINRPRLVISDDQELRFSLCTNVAPAGFGKTTLANHWRERLLESNNKVAWLTLDESDEDINSLICYIIFSLVEAGVDVGKLEMLAEQGLSDTTPKSCLANLINYISQDPKHVFIILDDYHRITSPETNRFMDYLLKVMPDNFHIIINSRERLELNLSRLLSLGKLLEFSADDLRFDFEEMKEALNIKLDENLFEQLLDKTEGWAVTIQLAKIAIKADADSDRIIQSITGKSTHLAEYLSKQILDKLPSNTREFLIKTSILERINEELGLAVCGASGGLEMFNELASIDALLVPLDEDNKWYRYHHLFMDFLQDLLKKDFPEEESALHNRASHWFEINGNLAEAVRHASLAKDFERAARLILNAGGWELILYGGIGFLRNLLRYIPEESLKLYPRLQVAKAYLLQKEGRIKEARHYVELARENNRLKDDDYAIHLKAFERDFEMVSTLQGVYEDDNSKVIYHRMLSQLDITPPTDGISLGVLYCASALIKMATGEFTKGTEYVQQAVKAMRQVDSVLGLNYCYLHLGQLSFYQGKVRQADAYFQEARSMAEENFGSDSGLKYLADVSLYSLQDWRGEFNDELNLFEQALEHTENYDGWYESYISAYELLLVRAVKESQIESIKKLHHRCKRVYSKRGIDRLKVLVQCCEMLMLTHEGKDSQAERIAFQLELDFINGNWRDNTLLWRPIQYVGILLSQWYLDKKEPENALVILDNLEACNRKLDVSCFLINALVAKASLLFQMKKVEKAAVNLFEAASLAWPENIKRPFTQTECFVPMVSSTMKTKREKSIDKLTLNFLQECVVDAKKHKKNSMSEQGLLSGREMEVLIELQGGLSNKEIARALEMTEHTVKFHMKNIFKKLKVDRRAMAIIVAREMNLLD